MKLAEMLKTLFEGMDVEPSLNIKDLFSKIGMGQSVAMEDVLVVRFPFSGEPEPLSQWGEAGGITLINTADCFYELLSKIDPGSTETVVQCYFSERTIVRILAEYMQILDKMRFDAVDPIKAREQFHELWESHACRNFPDPADVRRAFKEQHEQNRTNTEGVGPS